MNESLEADLFLAADLATDGDACLWADRDLCTASAWALGCWFAPKIVKGRASGAEVED